MVGSVTYKKGYIGSNRFNGKFKVKNMTRSTRLGAIFLMAMFISSALLVFVPSAMAQMSLQPTLTISPLNPDAREVVVTPSSIGSASFSGTISVTKPPAVGIVTVQLDGSCSTGWNTVVSPQTVPFTAPGDIQITVTVVVPQATPTSSIGKVLISGIASYPGGTKSASSSATVTVIQYFRINPQSQNPFVVMSPGTQAILTLDLYNRGNGLETMVIDFTNLKKLQDKNWVITPSTYQVDNVPTDEYDTIKITIKPEKPFIMSYKHGEISYLEITVSSENAQIQGLVVVKKFFYAIMEDGFFIPGFDVTFLVMAFAFVAAILGSQKKKFKR